MASPNIDINGMKWLKKSLLHYTFVDWINICIHIRNSLLRQTGKIMTLILFEPEQCDSTNNLKKKPVALSKIHRQ